MPCHEVWTNGNLPIIFFLIFEFTYYFYCHSTQQDAVMEGPRAADRGGGRS
jgi:hypothetical protein